MKRKRILTENEARRFRVLIATVRDAEAESFPHMDRSEFRARVESNHNILARIEEELLATIAHHEQARANISNFRKRVRR